MIQKTVYLAGPISGLSYKGATSWRQQVITELADVGIKGLSPMRAKEYFAELPESVKFTKDGDKYASFSVLSTNRGITTRDRWDAMRCDVLLVNFHGAKQVSIGTCMEVAWADAQRTPIVAVMEAGNPHEHGMLLEAIGFKVPTLEEAIHVVKALLL